RELQHIVEKSLRKDRENRYQTAKDLLIDLKDIRQDLEFQNQLERTASPNREEPKTQILNATTSDVAHTASSAEYVANEIKSHKRSVLAILSILLLGVFGLGYWFYSNRSLPVNSKEINSIAVLPLENISGDASQDYFADGMTDTLITELIKVGNLRVISRNSTMQFKGTGKTISEIARELDVDAIVEGTALRSGDKVRISVQLFRAEGVQNLWAESYERGLGDVLGLQREVARGIADSIKVKIALPEQAASTKQTAVKPEAHDALFRGRYAFHQAVNARSIEERIDLHEKSFKYYQQAIAIEPNYAEAYAALASSYHWLASAGVKLDEYYPKSIEAANKAIQIDETNAEAHNALAYCAWNYQWDAATAEKEYNRSFELGSRAAGGSKRGRHGYALLLSELGRHDEAIDEIKLAEKADPLNFPLKDNVGWVYFAARRYDLALEQFKRNSEIEPNYPESRFGISRSLAFKGMYQESLAEMRKFLELTKGAPESSPYLARVYAMAGDRGAAVKILNEHLKLPEDKQRPFDIAVVHAALSDKDQTIFWLEKSVQRRENELRSLKSSPEFDKVRDDPRFQDLLRRVGLTP
ncbi:MAG: hypothetical protein LC778_20890, partial [Acidobacteria bacterium]|nr:hypothetical protein [Acidobacteriota bacterium]